MGCCFDQKRTGAADHCATRHCTNAGINPVPEKVLPARSTNVGIRTRLNLSRAESVSRSCASGRSRRTYKPRYARLSNLIKPLVQKCDHGEASNFTTLHAKRKVNMSTHQKQVPGVR